MSIRAVILILAGGGMALAGLFFSYYSLRLLYLNLFMPDAASHRSGGMLIGALVFPISAITFSVISWICFRALRK